MSYGVGINSLSSSRKPHCPNFFSVHALFHRQNTFTMFSTKFQTALLLVLVSVSLSAGLKCYFCEYIEDYSGESCKNPGDDLLFDVGSYPGSNGKTRSNQTAKLDQVLNKVTRVQGAAGDAKRTVQLCQKIYVKVDGHEGISRLGGYGDDSLAGECEKKTVEGVTATFCWCDTDGCNGATATALNFGLVILGASCALFKLQA